MIKMGNRTYACKFCGLVYEKKEFADACAEYCGKNHACSPEIAKDSIGMKQ